eukprot:augustus_masked-scaffold_17-processed-gene-2.6-mRNA-1 protein AED:1.00 eAED:1.00 QI:0/0/0/0/1/1/3/0/357
MKLHFLRTATWGIMTGARTVPEDPKELKKFERQTAGAFSDLVRCVEGDLEDLCLMFESVQEALKELQLVCVASENVKLQEAERDLEQLEAGPDVLLTVTKFKFVNSSLKEEFENLGVVHDVSPKHHPSMNGAVERWNRTLQDGYKVLLIDSGLTADYWPYAAKCFTYLHNRQFSRVTPEAKTPFESMYLRKPQVDHLFEFGRLGAARSGKQQKKGKMKGRKAIFLGYKGREYLVYWLGTKKVGTARWLEIDAGNIVEEKRGRNAIGFMAKALELLPLKSFTQITGRKDTTKLLNAHKKEVESLECIDEFDVVQLRDFPFGLKPLSLKEVFTIKDSGSKKVRLAVRGDIEKLAEDEDN